MSKKCLQCCFEFDDVFVTDNTCPVCGMDDMMVDMCPRDHCHCSHPISETITFCPDCGEPMCPKCECHDVVQISRVTGYLQEVGGWNAGKQQELKDRKRYSIGGDDEANER
jgi:hypothetical protein